MRSHRSLPALLTFVALVLAGCALLVPGSPAEAQSPPAIRGKVVDTDGVRLSGVTITVQGARTEARRTDANGEYLFSAGSLPAGSYTLIAGLPGLPAAKQPATVERGQTATVDFTLTFSIEEEILVTGTHIRGGGETGAVAVSVLPIEHLAAFGETTVGELFDNIAQSSGMDFNEAEDGPNSARGDVATVNLRGLGGGNTLVLLNGRRMTPHPISQDVGSTPATLVNVNQIPGAAIERVEVLRDGASALYGADATAGVVNTVLDTDYDGMRVRYRNTGSEGTDFREQVLDLAYGKNLNDGRTNFTFFATGFDRDGIFASEREYAASVDKRPLLPDDWAGDSQFRNLSPRGPFGEFVAGGVGPSGTFDGTAVNLGGSRITSRSGRFHIQPPGTSGGVPFGALELDDGSQSSALWYDFNIPRQITPDARRSQLFAALNHQINDNLQFFSEVTYYDASTRTQRAAQPIDNDLAFIIVPRQNYYNPFGPVGSPSRLAGIDAPDGGLDILIRRYRPLEHGPRIIEVDSEMLRVLGGVRGLWKGWNWEAATLYTEATARDEERNRISKTALFQQLALDDPTAFNPFAPNSNSQATLDAVRVSTVNRGKTSLATTDFRLSNASLSRIAGGDVGVALGGEWRRERYTDDRDPRLDGTLRFDGVGFGDIGNDLSDIIGVSSTADSSGERDVFSLFGESILPLVSPTMEVPGIHRLDLQLAVRGEAIRDTGEEILKPKVALSWFPSSRWLFRAAWSQGFRAPNLVQLNRGDISRLNQGQVDFYRAEVTGQAEDIGEAYRRSIRVSNPDLESEETETLVLGAELRLPVGRRFDIRLDYWQFEQENVISNSGVRTQLALDFLLRRQGSFNPNVIREPVTPFDLAAFAAWNAANPGDPRQPVGVASVVIDPYLNLDPRTVEGLDFAVDLQLDSAGHRWRWRADVTHLLTFDQERDSIQPLIDAFGSATVFGSAAAAAAAAVDRRKLEGNPELRATSSLTWRYEDWSAGLSFKYVDEFYDTRATNDITGEFWTVEAWEVWNLWVGYRFKDFHLRVGLNNIADEDPPLADEALGYSPRFHSNRGRQLYAQLTYRF